MSRRRRRNDWIPGAVITIIVIMLSVVFMGLLAMTKMVPTILYADHRHCTGGDRSDNPGCWYGIPDTGRFIGGTVLAVIMIAIPGIRRFLY